MLKVFIGFDSREVDAYKVAAASCRAKAQWPVSITPIELSRNEKWELISRPWRIKRGSLWDVLSNAPQSTEFAASRFLTPLLAQTGWSLFVDCDVVFLSDVYEIMKFADPRYAVMCVKHNHVPLEETKMDGQVQTSYPRKNWSSVVLWNSDHEANRLLTHGKIQNLPGRELHAFSWLKDEEIGELPAEWNWLVGVQPKPERARIAHFTLGGPWIAEWKGAEYDDLWSEHYRCLVANQ